MELHLLKDIVAIFLLAIAVQLIFHRFKVPVMVGLLLTGILAGPHGLGLISAVHEVEMLAEIGVVLLLFAIGIEFSLRKLLKLKKAVFLGGTLQVILTIVVTAVIMHLVGNSWNEAVFMGFLVALSSTAIVLKLLQERAEINAPHGQTSLAILIFQDLIIVPMIVLTPLLAGQTTSFKWIAISLSLKVVVVLVVVFILARFVIGHVFYQVARTRSRELFLMTVLGMGLAIAWLTSSIGLSLAMGAFLAGLIISESEYSHHAITNVLPFRDLFTSFFFVSMGMLLDISFFISNIGVVILITLGIIFIKMNLIGIIGTILGLSFRSALVVGFSLAQIGEFSFVLAGFGIKEGLLQGDIYQFFLSAAVISMAATPFVIASSGWLADQILKLPLPNRIRSGLYPIEPSKKTGKKDHLVIVGFGVNGKNLANAAKVAQIDYIILEMNPMTVRAERAKGEPIVFGDATREAVLSHAGIENAKAVVVAIPDAAATGRITMQARHLSPEVYILVRSRYLQEVERLYELGADHVIPEEFETSIEIFSKVLPRFEIPQDQIDQYVEQLKSECYRLFRKAAPDSDPDTRLEDEPSSE